MDKTGLIADISVEELNTRIYKKEELRILDVREPYEFEEFNLGATLIPLGDLKDRLSELNDWRTAEIIVHCRTGNRSAAAKVFMIQNGFTSVRSLIGGISAYLEVYK